MSAVLSMSVVELLECGDVATLVFRSLDTRSMVALSGASRSIRAAQRDAIRHSPQLLVRVAINSRALTKKQFMGWFALEHAEADALPRTRHKRVAGGFYFLYHQPAFEGVLGSYLANAKEWEGRIQTRRAGRRLDKPQRRKRPIALTSIRPHKAVTLPLTVS